MLYMVSSKVTNTDFYHGEIQTTLNLLVTYKINDNDSLDSNIN